MTEITSIDTIQSASDRWDRLWPVILGTAVGLAVIEGVLVFLFSHSEYLGTWPAFVPVTHSFLILAAICIAVLAFSHYLALRNPISFWVGTGNASFAVAEMFFALSWQDLLPGGHALIATLPNTSAWFDWLAICLLSTSFLLAIVGRWPGKGVLYGRRWLEVAVAILGAVLLVCVLAVTFEQYLPALLTSARAPTLLYQVLEWALILLQVVGVFVAARRYRAAHEDLAGYVALLQVINVYVVLCSLFSSRPYDLWFYLMRVIGIYGFLVMLFGLLGEYSRTLQRERSRLAEMTTIMDTAPAIIWISRDPQCLQMSGNRYSYNFLSLNPDTNVSMSASQDEIRDHYRAFKDGQPVVPSDMPMQISAATGQPIYDYEFDVVFDDGTRRHLIGNSAPLFDPSGKPQGAVGAFVNITRLQAAEAALKEANQSLERRVQERTEALQAAVQSLQAAQEELSVQNDELINALQEEKLLREQLIQSEKFAALARLTGSVAHEINNPLQTVVNCLYLLKLEPNGAGREEALEMAISESKRIGSLVQQLRETYKPSAVKPVDFNVSEVLNRTVSLLAAPLRHSSVVAAIDVDPSPVMVHGIPDQIQQVVLNICLNAIDAMSVHGGELCISAHRLESQPKACLAFRDTGSGIPQENLSKIFEPFFTTKEKGTGLGLAICYQIVKSHGGDITVESDPGKGTTFQVWLPAG